MPQSLSNILIHLVFSTKDRNRCFRTAEMRDSAAGYMTGILKANDCPVLRIAVVTEHIHVLLLLSRTRCIADVVKDLKVGSCGWIREQPWARINPDFAQFHWQKGYGVFSVSESKAADVKLYIDRQMDHHRRLTFEDEYRGLLRRHNIEFDEKYVWD
jgi:putative transposase